MTRMISLFLLAAMMLLLLCVGEVPAAPRAKRLPVPAWRVIGVKRTNTGLEDKLVGQTLATNRVQTSVVLSPKKAFLQVSVTYTPVLVKGNIYVGTGGHEFEVVNERGEKVGEQVFSRVTGRNVLMYFKGDWSSLKGLSLKGPGNRLYRLGPRAAAKKK